MNDAQIERLMAGQVRHAARSRGRGPGRFKKTEAARAMRAAQAAGLEVEQLEVDTTTGLIRVIVRRAETEAA
jgi:hypothetical protein